MSRQKTVVVNKRTIPLFLVPLYFLFILGKLTIYNPIKCVIGWIRFRRRNKPKKVPKHVTNLIGNLKNKKRDCIYCGNELSSPYITTCSYCGTTIP